MTLEQCVRVLCAGAVAFLVGSAAIAQPQNPSPTTRNRVYQVQNPTPWEVHRFAHMNEAVAFRDARLAAGADARLADFSSTPSGGIQPGPGANTEVYLRYWVGAREEDPHKAWQKLVQAKAAGLETRVLLTYERQATAQEQNFGGLVDRAMGYVQWVPEAVILPQLPAQFRQTETAGGTAKGSWQLVANTGEFRGDWDDGSGGWMHLDYWDQQQVVFSRRDNGGSNDGLIATYVGRFVGNSLMGEVTWTWRGKTWQGTWSASPGVQNISPPPQVASGCTRGPPVLVRKGSYVTVTENTLTYPSAQNRVINTIHWDPPPATLAVGDTIRLRSSSTGYADGKEIYVQWELHNGNWGQGANSFAPDGRSRETQFKYPGGAIAIVGGIRSIGDEGRFRLQWNYTCR